MENKTMQDVDPSAVKLKTDYWGHAITVLSLVRDFYPAIIGRIDIQFKHWENSALELTISGENPDPYIERGWRVVVYSQVTNSEPTVYHSNLNGSEIRTLYNGEPRRL